jgi:hypothetical protein
VQCARKRCRLDHLLHKEARVPTREGDDALETTRSSRAAPPPLPSHGCAQTVTLARGPDFNRWHPVWVGGQRQATLSSSNTILIHATRQVPNQQPPTHHHAHTPSLTSAGQDSLLRLTLPRTPLDCNHNRRISNADKPNDKPPPTTCTHWRQNHHL